MRTETVRSKVSHNTKVSAENILNELGLSMSEAINLMLRQVVIRRALPFDLTLSNQPNIETAKILKEAEAGIGLVECEDEKDLFKKLDI